MSSCACCAVLCCVQPFYSTSIMSRLVKTAEGHIESLVAQEAKHSTATQAAAAAQAAAGNTPTPAAAAAAAAQATPEAALTSAPPAAAEGHLAPSQAEAAAEDAATGPAGGAAGEGHSDTDTEELLASTAVCARTRVALQTWHQLCSNASTPSTVLPANSSQALVRALNVRQRWAKIVSMAPIMQQAGMNPKAGAAGAEAAAAAEGEAAAGGASAEQQQAADNGDDNGTHAGQKHKVRTGCCWVRGTEQNWTTSWP